jgi:hypothetical protein
MATIHAPAFGFGAPRCANTHRNQRDIATGDPVPPGNVGGNEKKGPFGQDKSDQHFGYAMVSGSRFRSWVGLQFVQTATSVILNRRWSFEHSERYWLAELIRFVRGADVSGVCDGVSGARKFWS